MAETIEKAAPVSSAAPPATRAESKKSLSVRWRNPERILADYVSEIWSRWKALLIAAAVCGAIGLIYALRKPNTYASRATMIVHGGTQGLSTADAAARLLGKGQILPSQVMTAVEILRSRLVLQKVVERVGYEAILGPYQPTSSGLSGDTGILDRIIDGMHRVQASWFAPGPIDYSRYHQDTLIAFAVDSLQANLLISPSIEGPTISLAYLHTSPTGAQKVLAAVAEESMRRYAAVVAPPEGKDWLDVKLREAGEEEAAARAALEKFGEEHGTTDQAEEIRTLTLGLATLTGSMRSEEIKLLEHEKIVAKMREEMASTEPQLRDVEGVESNPVRQQARSELLKLRVLEAGEEASGSSSPMLKKIQRQIAALEEQLEEIAVRPNPRYRALELEVQRREIELIALREQIPLYDDSLRDARRTLEQKRALQRDVAKLQDDYRSATAQIKRLNELSKTFDVNSELDVRGLTNLRLVEPAAMPRVKQGPRRARLVLGAMFGALVLGISWILLRVRLGRKLLRRQDVTFALGRADVVGIPLLTERNLARFEEARRRGWE